MLVHKFPYFHWSFYKQENINITTVEYIMRYLYFQSTRQIRKYCKKKSRKSGEELCPFKDFSFIDIVDWLELHKWQDTKNNSFCTNSFQFLFWIIFFPHFIPTLSFLAHLTQRVMWAIVTTERPSSSVRPLTFHILINSSEATGPIWTKLW